MPKTIICPYCNKKLLSTTYKMIEHVEQCSTQTQNNTHHHQVSSQEVQKSHPC